MTLTTYIETLSARRERPQPTTGRCPCCGETFPLDEFDTLGALFPSEHLALLRAEFGGLVCNSCADDYEVCGECGEVRSDVQSTTWGARCCSQCEDRIQARRRY